MISCKYISFCKIFRISKAFSENKGERIAKRKGSKGADNNEGRFVLNIDVLFAL
jgi:hypothetical protein